MSIFAAVFSQFVIINWLFLVGGAQENRCSFHGIGTKCPMPKQHSDKMTPG